MPEFNQSIGIEIDETGRSFVITQNIYIYILYRYIADMMMLPRLAHRPCSKWFRYQTIIIQDTKKNAISRRALISDFSHTKTHIPPVLSTCPLHTNSGCGKEGRILIGPWWSAKAAPARNYLEVLSAVNAIGTQLRDPINSGLTRWRMAVS